MLPLNGADLIMALPQLTDDTVRDFVIVVRVDELFHPYISARVKTLDDPTWAHGEYFTTVTDAVRSAYTRGNVFVPWAEDADIAS